MNPNKSVFLHFNPKNMKKLFILFSLFLFVGCSTVHNSQAIGQAMSYTVNIYDANGEWYESGLLVESFDNKVFIMHGNKRYELLKSDREDFKYMMETEKEVFYVK